MLSMILYIFFMWVIWLVELACFWVNFGRFCEETNSLISDAIGVSYPVSFCSNFYAALFFFFFLLQLNVNVWMFCGNVKMNQDPDFLAENFSKSCSVQFMKHGNELKDALSSVGKSIMRLYMKYRGFLFSLS